MESRHLVEILKQAPSPCFVILLEDLRRNLRILKSVKERTDCKILLALKGFSNFQTFPMLSEVLDGTCASSVNEARLGQEEFGGEVEIFAPAFREQDIEQSVELCDHVIFNSFGQLAKYRDRVLGAERAIDIGLRVNPEHSEGAVDIYNPCAPFSRLGIPLSEWDESQLVGVSGLHFHTLCEQGSDALEGTLRAFEAKFAKWIPQMKWVNFGGGHHITQPGYDVDLLVQLINDFKARYEVQVYLEPGEAVALNAGVFVTRVVDVLKNQKDIAILDTSASCHLADVLEMPFRPGVVGGGEPGEKAHTYILGGQTCLAGDVLGEYSFDQPLKPGDPVVFTDMAHYTMVKTTTFNGVNLPSIGHYDAAEEKFELLKEFGYKDFKERLG
ncbi:MAG: carboxynorspermidine decarboxylase [Opitutales bacterium]